MTTSSPKILFLFPGQGAQYPGIGSDLLSNYATARDTYESASKALGYDMFELSDVAAGDEIHLTQYTQPALLTHSSACLRVFLKEAEIEIKPAFTCGHSLGEYSALVAAGAIDFESAVKLVSRRGELMGKFGEGEMQALPLTLEQASSWIYKNYCAIAACNLPEQTVAGGRPEDLDRLITDLNGQFPGKTGVRLKTEGAFHTYYMISAAYAYRKVIDEFDFRIPICPVASNFTGDFHEERIETIQSNLFYQLFHPVLFHKNLMTIAEQGVDVVIEFGGGLGAGNDPAEKRPNLAGTITRAYRRASPRPVYHSVINMKTLESAVLSVQNMAN